METQFLAFFEHDCRSECECALITKTVSDITVIACLLWDLKADLVFPSEDRFFFFLKRACEKSVRCQQIKSLPGNTEGMWHIWRSAITKLLYSISLHYWLYVVTCNKGQNPRFSPYHKKTPTTLDHLIAIGSYTKNKFSCQLFPRHLLHEQTLNSTALD